MNKKTLIIATFLLSTFSMAQKMSKKDKKQTVQQEIQHINVKVMIPFTGNGIVDQYMSDYQRLVNLARFVVRNGDVEMKTKFGEEYTLFTNKYTEITKEIRLLTPENQEMVSKYVNARSTELSNLLKN